RCRLLSGTSFSAPEVAGALALLLQAFPNLTGRQAVDILLRTATDLGANGSDAVYGRGLLNLAAAFSPVGALSVQSAGGAVEIATSALSAGIGSAAFGDALAAAPLATVGYDQYHRAFSVDLGRSFPLGRPTALAPAPGPSIVSVVSRFDLAGAALSFAASAPRFEAFSPPSRPGLPSHASARAALVTARFGRVSLVHWSGIDAPAPQISGPRDTFQQLAAPDAIEAGAVDLGGWSLSVERGQARRQAMFDPSPRPGPDYSTLALERHGDGIGVRLAVGRLVEPSGALGAEFRSNSPYLMPGRTQFASLFASAELGSALRLSLEASAGLSRAQGQLLSLHAGRTTSWRIALDGDCASSICSRFSLYAAQPLRLESGGFQATLPAIPDSPGESPGLSVRDFTVAPTGREIDIGGALEHDGGRFGTGGLAAALALQPGSRRDSGPAFGLSAYWRSRF
ncbi:MAG: peptidase and in kexin sedolisin, partial [Caulobacteraceae bacterium]|nr:peptidase and in kexin sedolisin [Caulobacteraceae bacterium]